MAIPLELLERLAAEAAATERELQERRKRAAELLQKLEWVGGFIDERYNYPESTTNL